MKRTKYIWLILIMFVIVGCVTQAPSTLATMPPATWTPLPTIPPMSAAELENFFGDASCSWPCWQGITPGITTSSEALQRLQESMAVVKSSLQSEGTATGSGSANWYWNIGEKQPVLEGGHTEWRNGLVWQTTLTAYSIISLGEIIDKFGLPEKIDVTDCSEIVERPPVFCAVLYYAKNGFEIHVRWESSAHGEDIEITPADPIDTVMLFESSTIEEWSLSNGIDVHFLNLQDWKGYGNLFDLYY